MLIDITSATTCMQHVRKHMQNMERILRRLLKVTFNHKSSPFQNPFALWNPEWEGHEFGLRLSPVFGKNVDMEYESNINLLT